MRVPKYSDKNLTQIPRETHQRSKHLPIASICMEFEPFNHLLPVFPTPGGFLDAARHHIFRGFDLHSGTLVQCATISLRKSNGAQVNWC